MATEGQIMVASHNPYLVALSVVVSLLGAYAAIALSERVRDARGWAWLAWLVGGAAADGIGTWSMHYTGMLALRLPVAVWYDWPTVLLSLLVGIIGSAGALFVLSHRKIGWLRVFTASIFMGGVGISGLHYVAMMAMRLRGMHHYDPALSTLAVVLAIVISWLSLTLTFFFRDNAPGRGLRTHGSALLRGSANPIMHYTAMAAASFTYSNERPDLSHVVGIESLGLLGISIVPAMGLVVVLLTTLVGRLRKERVLLQELFEQSPQAIALLSVDNRVVRVNRAFSRLFGYRPQETLGRRLGDLIVPDESRAEEQSHMDLLAHGQRVDAESVRRRKDGSRLQVAMVLVPFSVPGGEIQIYAIYRDVTERKRAEQARQELVERLQTLSRRLLQVQEAERRHLARELHDEVGQQLTGLRLLLTADEDLPADALRTKAVQAQGIVDELLDKVRELSFDLRPAMLDHLGLLPALLWLFERFTAQTKVRVHFRHEGLTARFAPEVETTAYRLAQEALTNVVRHASVQEVAVRVWLQGGSLYLQVEDEGAGFVPEAALASDKSSGLAGMRERAQLLGGQLVIDSVPGEGTQLMAQLPLGS